MTLFRFAAAGAALLSAAAILPAEAGDKAVRIGVLNDLSGPYADLGGVGSKEAAEIAVEEFGGTVLGKPVEVLSADHMNKPDIGAQIARRWFDVEGVDMVTDFPNSGVALAVQAIARERKKIAIYSTAAAMDLQGKACSPYGFQWTYDSYSNAVGLVRALSKEASKSWAFITVDYAFGLSLEAEAIKAVKASGGTVKGTFHHPLNTGDFSSFLLQAQSSGAQVVALANSGADTINGIKQAAEFGIVQGGQTLVAPVVFLTDVKSLGLDVAQGLTFVTAFYWDKDDETRAFAKKFYERRKAMPTMAQAGVYSGVLHYLKAVKAAGTTEGDAVAAKMREMPVNDAFAHNGTVRADGRMVHDMYLVEVKKPSESKGQWDFYKILATIPGKEAFRPLSESDCPLLTQAMR